MPKISVVIPLYNKAPHISRAVLSVLNQTEQDFEIIVVNDASTDGSEKIATGISDSRIKLFNRETPGPGGHAARNMGIFHSHANIIAFLDADDAYKPAFLETILQLQNRYHQAGAYSTSYEIITENNEVVLPRLRAVPHDFKEGIIPDYFKAENGNSPVWTSATAIPKKVIREAGGFPEGIPRGGDIELWAKIALSYPVAFTSRICAVYYKNASNRIGHSEPTFSAERIAALLDNAADMNLPGFVNKQSLGEFKDHLLIYSAKEFLANNEHKTARKLLQMCQSELFSKNKSRLLLMSFLPHKIAMMMLRLKHEHKS